MRKRWRAFALWLLVAIGFLGVFWYRLDGPLVAESLRRVNRPIVLLAILPILLTYLTRSLRWRAFLAPIGSPALGDVMTATVIGFSMIFVFGRLGEATRPLVLSLRTRIRPSATIATILIERVYDMITVAIAFAVSLFFLSLGQRTLPARLGEVALALSVSGLMGLIIFRIWADGILTVIEHRGLWIPETLRRPALNLLRHLADGLSILQDARALARTVIYTILTWGLVAVSFWLVTFAFGLRLTVASVIFVIGFAMMGSLVPTPGGSAGAFHTATMVGLLWLGIEKNLAASMAVILHVVSFGPALLVSPYLLRHAGLGRMSLRELAAAEVMRAEPSLPGSEREQKVVLRTADAGR